MTTPVGHTLFAFIVHLTAPHKGRKESLLLFGVLVIAALAPDFDYFPLLWGDFTLANLNHQGFSHSIFFALIAATALAYVAHWLGCGKTSHLFPFVFSASLSHLLLDYLTFDGREPIGIMLLWPFSDARFNSPFSVFGGIIKDSFSEIVSLHNLGVVLQEALVLFPVVLLVWFIAVRFLKPGRNQSV